MGIKRNAILSVAATGLLLVGLLVLIPEPAQAVQAQAPFVVLTDRLTTSDTLLTTRLTTQVFIPAGELIPITYGELRFTTGAPTFDGTGRLTGGTSCAGTIISVSGPALTFGQFQGYGYTFVTNSNGYGYDFGSSFSVDFSTLNTGYTLGYGYGYGSTTAATLITVVIEANGCPDGAAIPLNSVQTFTFQAIVGADATRSFASQPSTVTLRDPEDGTPVTGGDTTPGVQSTSSLGATQSFGFSFFAGTGFSDGTGFIDGEATDTFVPLPGPIGSFITSMEADFDVDLPEGVGLNIQVTDQDTTGGTFTTANPGCGINPTAFAGQSSVAPAGCLNVQMTGLPAGITPSAAIDLRITLDVPIAYFTGPPALSVGSFRLVRFNDDGTFNAAAGPSCVFVSSTVTDYRFTCTITDFSSFAMVASVAGGGGGGGVISSSTSSTSATSTLTSTGTGTGTSTGTGTTTGTGSDTGSATSSPTKSKGRGGIPGIEVGLIAIGLLGVAMLARRKLK